MQNYVEISGVMGRVLARMGTRNYLENNFRPMEMGEAIIGYMNDYEKALFSEEFLLRLKFFGSLLGVADPQEVVEEGAIISKLIENQVKNRISVAKHFDFFEPRSNGSIVGRDFEDLLASMGVYRLETSLNAETPLGEGINAILRMSGHHPQPSGGPQCTEEFFYQSDCEKCPFKEGCPMQ